MGKMQRTKGAAYEREVVHALRAMFPVQEVARHLGQARDSGEDIELGRLVIEVKRRKSLKTLYGWMRQACAAVGDMEEVPIVITRADNEKSLVILYLEDIHLFAHAVALLQEGEIDA